MAFQVLDEEQIALLTAEQKKQYEDTLALYNDRAAFVESMNALENVRIPSYEPKLQEITVIDGMPESDYVAPEYTVQVCVPAARPEPQFNVLELDGPISVALPQYSIAVQVEVENIKKVEAVWSELPEIVKAEKAAFSFTKPEKAETVLPEIIKAEKATFSFTKPEKAETVLPEITIGYIDIQKYKKPEPAQNIVPAIRKPEIAVKNEGLEPVRALLPELSGMELIDIKFTRPEISDAEIPEILRPDLPVHDFEPIIYSVLSLSTVRKPSVKVREIQAVERVKNDRRPELPAIENIRAAEVVFKPVKVKEPKIKTAPISIIRVKPFAKAESSVKGMPGLATGTIPNAGEKLRKLLSTAFLPDNVAETEIGKSER